MTFFFKTVSFLALICCPLSFCYSEGCQQSTGSYYLFFSPKMIQSHLASYTDEEKVEIEKDLAVVRGVCFDQIHPQTNMQPIYLASAGAPGARKSTILERFVQEHPEYSHGVYVDPDQRGLKFMVHTYYQRSLSSLASAEFANYGELRKKAYEKWRGASNYITLTLLEEALQKRYDIVHGSTSTGGHMGNFLKKLKEAGYRVVLLLCSCEDELRRTSLEYRNQEQKFYQSNPEEEMSKSKLFVQRMPIYFAYADELVLIWSDALFQRERIAGKVVNGVLVEYESEALSLFVRKFESDRGILLKEGVSVPSWNELVGKDAAVEKNTLSNKK